MNEKQSEKNEQQDSTVPCWECGCAESVHSEDWAALKPCCSCDDCSGFKTPEFDLSEYKQKYTDEQYLDAEYFAPSDEVRNIQLKLVVTRKPHKCFSVYGDPHLIQTKTKVVCENGIHVDEGRVRNYICLKHADEVLDEIYED